MTGADRAPAARVRTGADFFLSHATSDGAWAEWIAWTLETDGYRVLIQAWDSVAGTHQPQLVQEFMRRADRVIALLSPDYLASPTSSWEWSAAAYEDPAGMVRRLVPVRIATCSATGLLRTITAVDLVGLGEQEARDRLLAALAALRVGRAKPAEAPSFPSAVRYPAPPPGSPEELANLDIGGPEQPGTRMPAGTVDRARREHGVHGKHREGREGWEGRAGRDGRAGRVRLEEAGVLVHGNLLSRASRSVWVAALAFAPGGEILATGADDGSTRLWDVADLSRTRDILRLNDHRGWVRAVACAPRGSLLMTAGEDGVVVARDIRHPTVPGEAEVIDEHGEPVWAMAFDPRTDLLATADDRGRVCLRPVAWHQRDVRPAPGSAASATSARPAAAARSVGAGEPTQLLIGDRPAGALAFSPRHPVLACGSADGTVSLWPSEGSATRPAHLLTDHDDGVWAVAYSPDGSRLATGSDDGTVRLWDVENPAGPVCVARADHGGRRVRTVAFSPDGTLLVVGGDGDVVRVWDLRRGDVPSLAVAHHGVGGRVLAAAFAPRPPAGQLPAGGEMSQPHLLALGCADGRVRLCRIALEDPGREDAVSRCGSRC